MLELEARVKAYESEQELLFAMAESAIAENETPQSPGSPAASFETGSEEIDENPLILKTARLVVSPEGQERKSFSGSLND